MKRISKPIADDELLYLLNRDDPYIIECGAHDGRDTERFLKLFPRCRIIAFEPDPRPINRLHPPGFLARVGNDPRTRLIEVAVGDKEGTAILYRSSGTPPKQVVDDWDHSSSLRRPTGHLEWSPWCTFPQEKEIEVQVITLDKLFEDLADWSGGLHTHKIINGRPFDLIWIDVQGGQEALIKGGASTIKQSRYVFIECHKTPMYDGEPTQIELVHYFDQLGFDPIALYEGYNFLFESVREC